MHRLNAVRLRRVQREMQDFKTTKAPSTDGVVELNVADGYEDTMDRIHAVLMGPDETPFENLAFRVLINIPAAFPMEPPHIVFADVPFHPNISPRGMICVSFLKPSGAQAWSPGMSLRSALIALRSLLADATPEDPLNADAASHWLFAKDVGRWDSYRAQVIGRLAAVEHAGALQLQRQREHTR